MRILAVEDDPAIARVLSAALREAGYAVDLERDASEALIAFEVSPPDLVLLDLRLPGLPGGGKELCSRIRAESAEVPILMLTAMDSRADKVDGLDRGADDYLTKPFDLVELLARVRALLRRSGSAVAPRLVVGDLVLDPATRRILCDGAAADLSAREFAVLEYLMRRPGTIVSASELIDHAWDSNFDGWSNVVASVIRHLRSKLSRLSGGAVIRTHRGSGYSITATS